MSELIQPETSNTNQTITPATTQDPADTTTNTTTVTTQNQNTNQNVDIQNTNTQPTDTTNNTNVVTSSSTGSGVVNANANVDSNTTTTVTTNSATGNTNQNVTTLSLNTVGQQVNISSPTWDVFLIGFFLVGALLYGLTLGKDRIIAIIVSIYIALAVVHALPDFVFNVVLNQNYTLQITAFIGVFIVLFFMLSRQAMLNAVSDNNGKWWQVILFSFLHVGLLISVTMSFLPPIMLAKFSGFTLWLFTDQWSQFGWIITPVIAMIFFNKNKE